MITIFTVNSSYGQNSDSLTDLPFKISHLKKLDSLELAEKKEGTFVTGIPDISIDQ